MAYEVQTMPESAELPRIARFFESTHVWDETVAAAIEDGRVRRVPVGDASDEGQAEGRKVAKNLRNQIRDAFLAISEGKWSAAFRVATAGDGSAQLYLWFQRAEFQPKEKLPNGPAQAQAKPQAKGKK